MSFFSSACTHDLVNLGIVPCEMANSILMHKLLNTSSATQMIGLKAYSS